MRVIRPHSRTAIDAAAAADDGDDDDDDDNDNAGSHDASLMPKRL